MIELIKTVFSLFADKQIRIVAFVVIILCSSFNWLDGKFERIYDKLNVVAPKESVTETNERVERVDKRLITVNEKLTSVDTRLGTTYDKLASIDKMVVIFSEKMNNLEYTVHRIISEYYADQQQRALDVKSKN